MVTRIKTADETFIARKKNETFIVDAGTDLVFLDDNIGILGSKKVGGRTIRVDGTIDAPLNGSNAIQIECSGTNLERIIVGSTGEVSATGDAIVAGHGVGGGSLVDIRVSGNVEGGIDAIFLNTGTATLRNSGTIKGGSFSAVNSVAGDLTLKNSGSIEAVAQDASAIVATGRKFGLTNTGTVISENGVALLLDEGTSGAGKITIVNDGTIAGAVDAIRAESSPSNRAFTIVNTGEIIGNINLSGSERNDVVNTSNGHFEGDILTGDGDDRIAMIEAIVTGTVFGGLGDDVYTISSGDIAIVENADAGTDTIRAVGGVSVILGANFENLVLIGKRDTFHAAGNELDNTITGNAGDNVINGAEGEDTIRGGKGFDELAGGADIDTFIFRKGDDKDVIGDFDIDAITHDVVDLSGIKGITGFGDLINHHARVVDGDVVINAGDGDRVVLEGLALTDLRVDMFLL